MMKSFPFLYCVIIILLQVKTIISTTTSTTTTTTTTLYEKRSTRFLGQLLPADFHSHNHIIDDDDDQIPPLIHDKTRSSSLSTNTTRTKSLPIPKNSFGHDDIEEDTSVGMIDNSMSSSNTTSGSLSSNINNNNNNTSNNNNNNNASSSFMDPTLIPLVAAAIGFSLAFLIPMCICSSLVHRRDRERRRRRRRQQRRRRRQQQQRRRRHHAAGGNRPHGIDDEDSVSSSGSLSSSLSDWQDHDGEMSIISLSDLPPERPGFNKFGDQLLPPVLLDQFPTRVFKKKKSIAKVDEEKDDLKKQHHHPESCVINLVHDVEYSAMDISKIKTTEQGHSHHHRGLVRFLSLETLFSKWYGLQPSKSSHLTHHQHNQDQSNGKQDQDVSLKKEEAHRASILSRMVSMPSLPRSTRVNSIRLSQFQNDLAELQQQQPDPDHDEVDEDALFSCYKQEEYLDESSDVTLETAVTLEKTSFGRTSRPRQELSIQTQGLTIPSRAATLPSSRHTSPRSPYSSHYAFSPRSAVPLLFEPEDASFSPPAGTSPVRLSLMSSPTSRSFLSAQASLAGSPQVAPSLLTRIDEHDDEDTILADVDPFAPSKNLSFEKEDPDTIRPASPCCTPPSPNTHDTGELHMNTTKTDLTHASDGSVVSAANSTTTTTTTSPCTICLEAFEENQLIRDLPCKHSFHASCIDPWLTTSASYCPLCKLDVIESLAMKSFLDEESNRRKQNEGSGLGSSQGGQRPAPIHQGRVVSWPRSSSLVNYYHVNPSAGPSGNRGVSSQQQQPQQQGSSSTQQQQQQQRQQRYLSFQPPPRVTVSTASSSSPPSSSFFSRR